MKPSVKKTVYLITDILLSLMIFLSGILLCLACLEIYSSADTQMFTYEKIGAEWAKIDIPIYLTIALAAARAVAAVCLENPLDKKERLLPHRSEKAHVERLLRRVDEKGLQEQTKTKLTKERRLRRTLKLVDIVVCTLCAAIPLIYIANPARYLGTTSAECTNEVLHSIVFYLVCLLPAAIFHIVYGFMTDNSYRREAEILKSAQRLDGTKNAEKCETAPDTHAALFGGSLTNWLRVGIIAVAAVFIVIGSLNGGAADVLKKAAEICAECIGLG